jgi:hypothetical protein
MQNSKPIKKWTSKKAMYYGFEKIRTFIITDVLSYSCNEVLLYLFNDMLLYCLIDECVCCCNEVQIYRFAGLLSSINAVSMKHENKFVNQCFSDVLQK